MTTHAWHELIHLAAALVLTAGGAVIVARGWRDRRSAGSDRPERSAPVRSASLRRPPTEVVVARFLSLLLVALSLGAAAIHLAAAPEHFQELGLLGIGFPLAGTLQAVWAGAWWLRPTKRVWSLGIVLNGAIALAWAWSRIVGLPAGSSAWQPQVVGMPDVVATLFEVVIVALLIARLTGRDIAIARRARDLAAVATIAIVPAVGVVFLATLLAINVAARGHGAAGTHADRVDPGAQTGHEPP